MEKKYGFKHLFAKNKILNNKNVNQLYTLNIFSSKNKR